MSRRALRPASVVATGAGQMLFCESPATGALLLLSIAALAPLAGLMSAVGAAFGTATAAALRYPRGLWLRGVYGYAGALVGLFVGVLFAPTPTAWLAVGAAAALSAPLTRLAQRWLTPHDLPTLALPALPLVWALAPLLQAAPPRPDPSLLLSLGSWAVTLLGLLMYSRLLAVGVVLGGVVGIGLGLALEGQPVAGIFANTVPTAAALGGVFLPCSGGALAVAATASALAGLLWWLIAPTLIAWHLPPMVAPFTLVTMMVLLALRRPAVLHHVPGRPAPLPLLAVASPERGRQPWLARRRLRGLVRTARRIAVLTGAGVSTAAGIPDVRGPRGLWLQRRRIALDEFVASREVRAEYWREDEAFFTLVRQARPAPVHRALADLYRRGRLAAVITQNVDGLHQAAGIPEDAVIELHGAVREARCLDCEATVPREELSPSIAAGVTTLYCPACQGLLKGGGVMFGEPLDPRRLDAALRALLGSDLLLVLGTSLTVAPASDIVRWARDGGVPTGIINATRTPSDRLASASVTAEVGEAVLDLFSAAT